MAAPEKLKLYSGDNLIEDSQLRSVLLFSKFAKNKAGQKYMIQRLVLSIVIQEDGNCGLIEIQNALSKKAINLKPKEISQILDELYESKLVMPLSAGKYRAIASEDEGREYFLQLSIQTDNLIDGIFQRYEKLCDKPEQNPALVKDNIRLALSVYYKMAGLTFFRLQKGKESIKQAIGSAFSNGLDMKSAKRLIVAIGDAIDKPTPDEKACMVQWARAYVVTQILQLDPTLKNFKQERLKNKSFVLDTDVVLRAITTHTSNSAEYRRNIDYIRKLGCKIYIPDDVIREVRGCAEEALSIAATMTKEQLLEFDDTMLRGSKSNVFIEDYVNRIRSDEDNFDLPFSIYIGNIYQYRDKRVLARSIASIIGEENLALKMPEFKLDEKLTEELRQKIYEQTSNTTRGVERSDKSNESLSESDAYLYLTIQKCNNDQDNIAASAGLLPYKYYLLTTSHRTIDCAKSLGIYTEDIICNPKSLSAVLAELGDIQLDDAEVINLFENPFLVYTADAIWEQIEPLLKAGAHIYHADTNLLKSMVDQRFDEVLMCKTIEERTHLYRDYHQKGFKFSEDLAKLKWDNVQLSKENIKIKEESNQKDEEIKKLRHQVEVNRYERRVRGKNIKKQRTLKNRK